MIPKYKVGDRFFCWACLSEVVILNLHSCKGKDYPDGVTYWVRQINNGEEFWTNLPYLDYAPEKNKAVQLTLF